MRTMSFRAAALLAAALLVWGAPPASADQRQPTPPSVGGVNPQCPGDTDGDGVSETPDPNVLCQHLTAGDGFAMMADGEMMYMFGFRDVTGTLRENVIQAGTLRQEWPAPTITAKEGQDLYLSLTNVGMQIRPDLFDPHTVHYHGFPQASAIFDGLPESGISIRMGSTLTYYYKNNTPGTFLYHCHVEATEHMQMGMLGNLYVYPAQNDATPGSIFGSWTHSAGDTYTYNDGDGSTYYDVEYAIQMASFDAPFHIASEAVQPLPFADMSVSYPMINGRGYPDTVNTGTIANAYNGFEGQKISSKIVIEQGQRALLRISSVDVVREWTLAFDACPMRVVGKDAIMVKSAKTLENLGFETSSITLGGGSTVDVIINLDPANGGYDVPVGVYPLYTTNLNYLSNNTQDFGGMMTEIHVVAGP